MFMLTSFLLPWPLSQAIRDQLPANFPLYPSSTLTIFSRATLVSISILVLLWSTPFPGFITFFSSSRNVLKLSPIRSPGTSAPSNVFVPNSIRPTYIAHLRIDVLISATFNFFSFSFSVQHLDPYMVTHNSVVKTFLQPVQSVRHTVLRSPLRSATTISTSHYAHPSQFSRFLARPIPVNALIRI